MKRTVLHIDMDAFFASVEQRDNPALEGRPIAVTGQGMRTVIVSPSYQARVFKVKTGMTKYQAQQLCPDIVFVEASPDKYASACRDILEILYKFTPDIEVFSIDEFFLDITGTQHLFGTPEKIAQEIRKDIFDKLKLNASVGISYNKLLAKFASDRAKPNNIFSISKDNIESVFKDAEVSQLCGIGKKTSQRLLAMGILTIGQLKDYGLDKLRRVFGETGTALHMMANGLDDTPVVPIGEEAQAKSIGHSMTFECDTLNPAKLSQYLLNLSDMAAKRLRSSGLSAGCVKLTIRYKSFKTFTRQKALSCATDDTKIIYNHARQILSGIKLQEPVRLLGVTCSMLSECRQAESLFAQDNKKYTLNKVLDSVNERFHSGAVCFASLVGEPKHKKTISPSWRPQGKGHY